METMKNVASLINEQKRKVESINKIAKWQSTIEGWEVSRFYCLREEEKFVTGWVSRNCSVKLSVSWHKVR